MLQRNRCKWNKYSYYPFSLIKLHLNLSCAVLLHFCPGGDDLSAMFILCHNDISLNNFMLIQSCICTWIVKLWFSNFRTRYFATTRFIIVQPLVGRYCLHSSNCQGTTQIAFVDVCHIWRWTTLCFWLPGIVLASSHNITHNYMN